MPMTIQQEKEMVSSVNRIIVAIFGTIALAVFMLNSAREPAEESAAARKACSETGDPMANKKYFSDSQFFMKDGKPHYNVRHLALRECRTPASR
ncbi:MAG: hypothetical protein LBH81_01170 [Rickettsiales bacterium]|jgi:hypothetical protein|nr:hypothetical protein [Rickettsiales bacterium]